MGITWSDEEKRELCEGVSERVLAFRALDGIEDYEEAPVGTCMAHAVIAASMLSVCGEVPLLQAGSACWPVVDLDNFEDDGKRCTHYAYKWSPESQLSRFAMAHGKLPEMHIWVGLLDEHGCGTMVDTSTVELPSLCRARGLGWERDDIPYIWGHELPRGVCYEPLAPAIGHVIGVLMKDRDVRDLLISVCPSVERYLDGLFKKVRQLQGDPARAGV